MTKEHTPEEIKYRLSNIGEAIGNIALDYIAELEQENAELKCECRRCVYSDSPCILSDYGKDRNGICDHFKDVFDEIVELKADNDARKFAMAMSEKVEKQLREENTKLKYVIEGYKKIAKWCDNCDKIAELKLENQKWKDEWQEQIQKATDEGYARTLQTMQLTKAKELLAKWVELYKPKSKTALPTPIQVVTEQFLKE